MQTFRVTAIFIGGVFLLVALFGFAILPYQDAHGFVRCPAEQMNNGSCANATDPLALLAFHVGAFQTFSAGIFGNFFAGLLLLTALAALAPFGAALFLSFFAAQLTTAAVTDYNNRQAPRQFIRWFSLHENSPNAF